MGKVFNPAQIKAIEAQNRKILVSAGAGAGKSGTMTERIIRLMENKKADLLQMLVITFTRDAAASIKDKIRTALTEKISKNPHNDLIRKSITSLPASHISTIHSFCSDIVRQGASFLGIDPAYTILDEGMRKKLFKKAVSDAIDAIGKSTYPRKLKTCFGAFARAVSSKNIPDLCLPVYDTLMGIPHPFERMGELIDRLSLSPNPWEEEIFRYTKLSMLSKGAFLDDLKDLSVNPLLPAKAAEACKQDIELLNKFIVQVNKATAIPQLISAVEEIADNAVSLRKPKDLSGAEESVYNQFVNIHGYLKNKPKSGSRKYLRSSLDTLEVVQECKPGDIRKTQNQLVGLKVLLEEIHNQYMAIKTEKSMLDYADLEQYAYELLTTDEYTDVRDYVQSTYKYVFVDECQDVSAIQHAIISAVDNGQTNMFYVGDIKQSIYRFRHADPLQFLEMRDRYSEDETAECRKIYFQHNYRSSASIIDGINMVFTNLLDKAYTEIAYEPGDHLLVGNDTIPEYPTEIILVNEKPEAEEAEEAPIDPVESQCVEIADRIRELIAQGYEYNQIVILLRSVNAVGQKIVDCMTAQHIPSYYNGRTAFFDTPEVSLFIEILKTVNNDFQDYPLLATLRSDLFRFTDIELSQIRLAYPSREYTFSDAFHACAAANSTAIEKRCHDALETIRVWKKEAAEIHKASDVVWNLLKKTNYYAHQSSYQDGEVRQKNLDAFYDKALSYEALGYYKLCDILEEIDTMRKAKSGSEDPIPMSDNDNFVRIMSIHGSKGLEFPVVFIMDLQKNIHHSERKKDSIQIHIETESAGQASLGVYMPCANSVSKTFTVHDTYGKEAFAAKKSLRELAEETRLLYVGMTRAMERLYLVGVYKEKNAQNWYINNKAFRLLNTASMLDMIMPTVLDGTQIVRNGDILRTPLWNVSLVPARRIETEAASVSKAVFPSITNDIDFGMEWDSIKESRTSLPSKTAVTYIQNETFVETDEDTDVPEDEETVSAITLGDEQEKPEFIAGKMEKPEGAVLGTVAHGLMNRLPLERFNEITDQEETRKALHGIIQNGDMISDRQAEKLYATLEDGIAEFLFSPLGRTICAKHADVLREQELVFRTTVNGYSILVQGVIDLMYRDENGDWVIVDYKTDFDTRPDALVEKHAEQLNYYRTAVEKINRENVSRMLIVSLRTGKIVEVPKKAVKYI